MEQIILIGGGGHCKSCIDVLEQHGRYHIAGIVDTKEKIGQKVLGYPIIGSDDDLPELISKYKNVLITVGQIKSAKVRISLYNIAKKANAILPVIISPLAYVSRHASIKEGTIIMHHAVVNAEATIGINNIINTKALIEHEVIIGDHCHVSTNAKLNGQVIVGDECFIGSGAVLSNNIALTNNVIISAGSEVMKDINQDGVFIKKSL